MMESKIDTYYEVDTNGKITSMFKISSQEKEVPSHWIKQWEGVVYKPVYSHLAKVWLETATDAEILKIKNGLDSTITDILAYKKQLKSKEMGVACQNAILAGFTHELRGRAYHFSYDQEAQLNFQDVDRLFMNGMVDTIGWTARHNGEKVRLTLEKSEFGQVYLAGVKHKQDCLNHLYDTVTPQIAAATTLDELAAVGWGEPEKLFTTKPDASLSRKVDGLSTDSTAQKAINSQLEDIMLEVADIALMASFY